MVGGKEKRSTMTPPSQSRMLADSGPAHSFCTAMERADQEWIMRAVEWVNLA